MRITFKIIVSVKAITYLVLGILEINSFLSFKNLIVYGNSWLTLNSNLFNQTILYYPLYVYGGAFISILLLYHINLKTIIYLFIIFSKKKLFFLSNNLTLLNVTSLPYKMNLLLNNPINYIHPALIFLTFSALFMLKSLRNKTYTQSQLWGFFKKWNKETAFLALVLGSWWALQETEWGGWWVWDNSENFLIIPLIILVTYIHTRINLNFIYYKIKLWELILMFVLTFQLNLQLNYKFNLHTFLDYNIVLILVISALIVVLGYKVGLYRIKRNSSPKEFSFGNVFKVLVLMLTLNLLLISSDLLNWFLNLTSLGVLTSKLEVIGTYLIMIFSFGLLLLNLKHTTKLTLVLIHSLLLVSAVVVFYKYFDYSLLLKLCNSFSGSKEIFSNYSSVVGNLGLPNSRFKLSNGIFLMCILKLLVFINLLYILIFNK